VRGFARFWWDFLVGDTPELFAAVLVIVGIISLVSLVGHDNTLAVILLPTLSVVALGASVGRAWRGSKRR
jgi:cytochrome c biogenesis factor